MNALSIGILLARGHFLGRFGRRPPGQIRLAFLKVIIYGINRIGDVIIGGRRKGFVVKCGIQPVLAYYSPIPHTALWKKAVLSSRYPLESDPVFTNNAVFPCRKKPFSWEEISRLKRLAAGEID